MKTNKTPNTKITIEKPTKNNKTQENIIIKRQNPNKPKKLKIKEIITTEDKQLLGLASTPIIISLIGATITETFKDTYPPLSSDLLQIWNFLMLGIGGILIMTYINIIGEKIEREKRQFKEKQKTITHKLPIQTIQNKNNIKKIETLANDPDTRNTVNNAIDDLIKINQTELNPQTKNQTNKTIINYILAQEKIINERKQLENIKTQTETHMLNKATNDIQQSNESIAESITQKYQWLNKQH